MPFQWPWISLVASRGTITSAACGSNGPPALAHCSPIHPQRPDRFRAVQGSERRAGWRASRCAASNRAGDEWVSLDLETTGLVPARDHILSLAAVPVHHGKVWLSERFERRVHTARGFGIDSIRHHRITPDEASAGDPIVEVVSEFLHWLGSRRLLVAAGQQRPCKQTEQGVAGKTWHAGLMARHA